MGRTRFRFSDEDVAHYLASRQASDDTGPEMETSMAGPSSGGVRSGEEQLPGPSRGRATVPEIETIPAGPSGDLEETPQPRHGGGDMEQEAVTQGGEGNQEPEPALEGAEAAAQVEVRRNLFLYQIQTLSESVQGSCTFWSKDSLCKIVKLYGNDIKCKLCHQNQFI